MISKAVSVTTSPTLILPADKIPRTVYIHNEGGAKIYLGGADVSTANGFHLGNGESQDIFVPTNEKLYAIVASSTNTINVLTPDLD
tara:strand:+ start:116 stop:373 length:258 start_codon:yes stop_codon:yes gene_type:complete